MGMASLQGEVASWFNINGSKKIDGVFPDEDPRDLVNGNSLNAAFIQNSASKIAQLKREVKEKERALEETTKEKNRLLREKSGHRGTTDRGYVKELEKQLQDRGVEIRDLEEQKKTLESEMLSIKREVECRKAKAACRDARYREKLGSYMEKDSGVARALFSSEISRLMDGKVFEDCSSDIQIQVMTLYDQCADMFDTPLSDIQSTEPEQPRRAEDYAKEEKQPLFKRDFLSYPKGRIDYSIYTEALKRCNVSEISHRGDRGKRYFCLKDNNTGQRGNTYEHRDKKYRTHREVEKDFERMGHPLSDFIKSFYDILEERAAQQMKARKF
jgi:hypothetical protein